MKKGFTLIELLVVVLIIGILAAVAVPQYTKAVDKARFTQVLTMMDSLKKGIDTFYLANGAVNILEKDLLDAMDIEVTGIDCTTNTCTSDLGGGWSVGWSIRGQQNLYLVYATIYKPSDSINTMFMLQELLRNGKWSRNCVPQSSAEGKVFCDQLEKGGWTTN